MSVITFSNAKNLDGVRDSCKFSETQIKGKEIIFIQEIV